MMMVPGTCTLMYGHPLSFSLFVAKKKATVSRVCEGKTRPTTQNAGVNDNILMSAHSSGNRDEAVCQTNADFDSVVSSTIKTVAVIQLLLSVPLRSYIKGFMIWNRV